MIRIVLILSLFACVHAPPVAVPVAPVVAQPAPVAPAPPAKNLVCEAFKGVNEKATCEPYFTDLGPLHIHAAMLTIGGQQLRCRYDVSMTTVLCTDPIVLEQRPPAPVQDAAKDTKPAAAKKPEPKK